MSNIRRMMMAGVGGGPQEEVWKDTITLKWADQSSSPVASHGTYYNTDSTQTYDNPKGLSGQYYTSLYYKVSEFDIKPGDQMKVSTIYQGSAARIGVFFDEDGNFISVMPAAQGTTYTSDWLDIPEGCGYIGLNNKGSNASARNTLRVYFRRKK